MRYPREQTCYVTQDDQKFDSYDEAKSWQNLLDLVRLYTAEGRRTFLQSWSDMRNVDMMHTCNVFAAKCYFNTFSLIPFVDDAPPFQPGWYRVSLLEDGNLQLQEVDK